MKHVDLLIYRQYEHKGVKILVKIDRYNKTISLVEREGNFRPKDWRFTDRQVEYLNGWRLILQAMDFAIVEAKKELEKFEAEDTEKLLEVMVELSGIRNEELK